MAYSFFSNTIVYIKFDWLINIKHIQQIYALDMHTILLWVYGFVSLKSIFLLRIRMALSSVISLDEMKSLVLTKRKTHQEISNILKERHPDMRDLSAMNVRRFCNENRIRTRTTLDDSEIEKEVTKSITEVISKFLQNIRNKMLFYS